MKIYQKITRSPQKLPYLYRKIGFNSIAQMIFLELLT